MIQLICQILN